LHQQDCENTNHNQDKDPLVYRRYNILGQGQKQKKGIRKNLFDKTEKIMYLYKYE